jgi:hypothetical protein
MVPHASEVRRIKLPLYAQAGVGWIWLIDPALELVEIFEVQGGRLIRVDAAKTTDARPLAPFTVEIALGGQWAVPEPAAPSALKPQAQ